MKTIYNRKGQPHIQPIGGCFSVTVLVHDAVPAIQLEILREKHEQKLAHLTQQNADKSTISIAYQTYQEQLEELLDAKRKQEYPFLNPKAARILLERVLLYHDRYYDLLAACVMPNHVHLLLDFSVQLPSSWDGEAPLPSYQNLAQVVGQIKGASATIINKTIDRTGPLWRPGYYDRYIRSRNHLKNERHYILNNPLNAGLVSHWNEYPYLYPRDANW